MPHKAWRKHLHRAKNASAIVGAVLLLLSLTSLFCVALYQQPPGAWMPPPGSVPPGGTYTEPPGTPPAGQIRVRFLAGSLIVANGNLPFTAFPNVKVTLGYMARPGMTWYFDSPVRALQTLTTASTWQYHFYKQHIQVQFFPIALALLAPWALRRWVFKPKPAWACQRCGYDLRATPQGPCPECGRQPATA